MYLIADKLIAFPSKHQLRGMSERDNGVMQTFLGYASSFVTTYVT